MKKSSEAERAGDPRGARLGWLVGTALACFGCGEAPYIVHAPPTATQEVRATGEAPAVYIIVQTGEEGAAVEAPVVQAAPPVVVRERGWTPDPFPGENPFERSRTWVGDYDCTQGNTGLALRIVDVRGRVVRAVFDFRHAPSGAAGAYLISGTYDPETRRVHFDPSKWIVQPDDYVMVSMEGQISEDGSLFAGKIPFPGCGAFHLKPTR